LSIYLFIHIHRDKEKDQSESAASSNSSINTDKLITPRNRVFNFLSMKSTTASSPGGDKEKRKGDKDRKIILEKDTPNPRGRERAPSVAATGGGNSMMLFSSTGGVGPVGKQEGLYIRYLRVGDIQMDVSLSGFLLNVENYRSIVEPYFCRGE
jgi:hypothetical protein